MQPASLKFCALSGPVQHRTGRPCGARVFCESGRPIGHSSVKLKAGVAHAASVSLVAGGPLHLCTAQPVGLVRVLHV